MPPPRFVRCNSTSELRSVSVTSGNGEIVGAGCAARPGDGEASGAAAVAVSAGAGEEGGGDAPVATAGCGCICFTGYSRQSTSPITQRVTSLQAVRSLVFAARALHN